MLYWLIPMLSHFIINSLQVCAVYLSVETLPSAYIFLFSSWISVMFRKFLGVSLWAVGVYPQIMRRWPGVRLYAVSIQAEAMKMEDTRLEKNTNTVSWRAKWTQLGPIGQDIQGWRSPAGKHRRRELRCRLSQSHKLKRSLQRTNSEKALDGCCVNVLLRDSNRWWKKSQYCSNISKMLRKMFIPLPCNPS